MRIDKPKTPSIKQLIKSYVRVAKDLHYKSCYIDKLKKAKTESELLTIMSQARNDYWHIHIITI